MNDFELWLLRLSRSLRASGECMSSIISQEGGATVFSMAAIKRDRERSQRMLTFMSSTSTALPAEYRLTPGRHSTGWPQTYKRETTSDSPSLTRPAPTAVQPRDDTERLDRLSELAHTYGCSQVRQLRTAPLTPMDSHALEELLRVNPTSP